MKRTLALCSALLFAQVLIAGVASAKYNSGDDIKLNLNLPINAPNLQTGKLTFGTQEAVHQTITNTSGASVDHSYIWIYVNGKPVAAIDPPKAMVRG